MDYLYRNNTISPNLFLGQSNIEHRIKKLLKEENGVETLEEILPRLIEQYDNNLIFNAICGIKKLSNHVWYMLALGKINISDISPIQLLSILNYKPWGEEFVLHNLKDILEKAYEPKIKYIVDAISSDESIFMLFWYKFMYEMDQNRRILFIKHLIDNKHELFNLISSNLDKIILENPNDYDNKQMIIPNTIKDIKEQIITHDNFICLLLSIINHDYDAKKIKYLCDKILNTYEKNNLGQVLIKTDNQDLIDYTIKNFNRIFNSSINSKMEMLMKLKDFLDEKTIDKYKLIVDMFDVVNDKNEGCYKVFNNILNYDLCEKINDTIALHYNKSIMKEIYYITHGATSYVYRVGDYVIKLSTRRFCSKVDRHFRIVKNKMEIIYDENGNPILYIEGQKYLNRDVSKITDEMIYQLFIDLKNSAYEITDPKALRFDRSNYDLLDNYKDADVDDPSELERLPDYFKENPLVIIDVDLIYKESDPNKCYFGYSTDKYTMDYAIEDHERRITNQKLLKNIHR